MVAGKWKIRFLCFLICYFCFCFCPWVYQTHYMAVFLPQRSWPTYSEFRGFFPLWVFCWGFFFLIKLVFLFVLVWVYFILFLIVRAGERTYRREGGGHEVGWVGRLGGVERGEIHDQILLYEEHLVIQPRYFFSAISSLENKIRDFLCTGNKWCLRKWCVW